MKPLIRSFGLLAALLIVLAACGGSSDDGDGSSTTTGAADDATTTTTADGDAAGDPGLTTTAAAAPVNNGDDVADAGETVAVFYAGTLDDGSEFDSNIGGEPFEFTLGQGDVIMGFDTAVTGLVVGESVTVTIPVEDAYGEPDPEAIIEFPIDEVPEEFREEGLTVQMANGAPGTIIEVTEDTVTVDVNHPLAGEALTFEIELSAIL